jgi:hypothetical protein
MVRASGSVELFHEYERQMQPVRDRFAASPTLAAVTAADIEPLLLELFLLNFAATGVRMTEPVEGWIRSAAERCEQLGDAELGRALRGHAAAEAGHHLMMVRDTHALVDRLNARHKPPLNAEQLLAAPPSRGARRYIEVHEQVITGPTPFAQVALEYEIEMLPVRYGPIMVTSWVKRLGEEILGSLSFITEHIELDVGHTKFNSRQLEGLLERNPKALPALVSAGTDVLDAYAQFIADCLDLANRMRREIT